MASNPNVLTNVPALPSRSKIIFPSAPTVPSQAVLQGAGSGEQYYAVTTWVIQTQDGLQFESLPGAEGNLSIAPSSPVTIVAPAPYTAPYALIGWNAYLGLTSGGEEWQATNLIGTNWVSGPTGGIISGPVPPTESLNELIFTYPARQLPYFNPSWHGHDDLSTSGVQQSITWYVDSLVDFEIPYIDGGTDAWAWKQFLNAAIRRVPFDFYPDSTLGGYKTLIDMDSNPKMSYRAPGLYSLRLKCREVILG